MSELELWNELGNVYFKTGAYDEAIRTFQKVIELKPDFGLPYGDLSAILISEERFEEAVAMLEKGIEYTSETAEKASLWNKMGEAYGMLQDFPNACKAYRKAVELDPQNTAFQEDLAEIEKASLIFTSQPANTSGTASQTSSGPTGQEESPAETGADAAVVSTAESPEPEVLAADSSSGTNSSIAVEETAPNPEKNTPNSDKMDLSILLPENIEDIDASAPGCIRLGLLHWHKQEYEKALRYLKISLYLAFKSQSKFQQALSFYAIAEVESDLGRPEDAIQAYQNAARLAPDRIFPWNKLGKLYNVLGRYEEALTALQQAINHNPRDPSNWNGIGDVYHKLGQNDDAISAYQLGNMFDKQGIEEDVLVEFEKEADSDQENPRGWSEAGGIYFASKAYADAVASFRRAAELDPSDSSIKASLEEAEQALADEATSSEQRPSGIETSSNLETYPHVEPFIQVPDLQEVTDPAATVPASTGNASEDAPDDGPEPAPAETKPEPEPAFWVFERTPAPVEVKQPARQYLPAVVEVEQGKGGLRPAYGSIAKPIRSFSCDQLLTDTFHENASVLVQLTPHPSKASDVRENNPLPADRYDQAAISTDVEPAALNSYPVAAEAKEKVSPSPAKVEHEAVDEADLDLHILEHDISAYRRVTEMNPTNDRAWDTLGNMYENIGLHSQAVTAYEQAITLAPDKEVYYYHLGIALGYQMQYNKAVQALKKVIELNPEYMLAHCALAGYYRRLGRDEEAREHVEIARPSMESESEYNRACFESIGGNTDRAIALLEIALKQLQVQPSLVQSDPDLDFIRKDPRFKELLAKNRLIRE